MRQTSSSERTRQRLRAVRITFASALVAAIAGTALAQPRREPVAVIVPIVAKRKPAQVPAPPPAAAPVVLPEPPIPVRQAGELGLAPCVPVLDAMSRKTLTSAYDVQSGWSRSDPTRHVFQSVAALTRPGNLPPDGVTALIAAPVTAGGCDGVAVQVFPLAGSCQNAQKVIMNGGRIIAPLMNTRIMQDAGGNRLFLLPGFANTCIAIAVDSTFGRP